MKVVFVCLSNICLSPMVEAMFKQMIRNANLQGQMNMVDTKDMAPAGLASKVHGIYETTPGKQGNRISNPWIT